MPARRPGGRRADGTRTGRQAGHRRHRSGRRAPQRTRLHRPRPRRRGRPPLRHGELTPVGYASTLYGTPSQGGSHLRCGAFSPGGERFQGRGPASGLRLAPRGRARLPRAVVWRRTATTPGARACI
ncbi:hypothetical protein SBRY_50432 [Actinacidiphila bryophytorum]|uniref:Uncharacterized protein n=1 Tax=Actinacidiphila bryophytorum TaxID=1436133 RepID=A0A9W4H4G9_9ACTN|nr:hypothetical protein SBRY_50432 [Actinacidiphila bryophytorum]